jgi:hypothetical protein
MSGLGLRGRVAVRATAFGDDYGNVMPPGVVPQWCGLRH